MNTFKKIIVLALATVFISGCVNTQPGDNPVDSIPSTTAFIGEERFNPGNYYDSISSSLSGDSLLKALNTLNNSKKKRNVTYDGMRQFLPKSDTDWLGTVPSNKFVGFYNNEILPSTWDSGATWNREHTWPKAHGGGSVDADAHMVRPTSSKVNSSRGSDFFAASGAYDPGEYDTCYRGICARIIFYCAIANTSLSIIDATSGGNNKMGKLSDLLKWNLQYLPNTTKDASIALRVEQNRNLVIQTSSSGQGNRNPFIDHPEYACKIWGTTNSQTRQICGM